MFLVQYNLVDNQNQQNSDSLYTFTHNKYYSYLLNIASVPIVFLKTSYSEFYGIIVILTKYWYFHKNKTRRCKTCFQKGVDKTAKATGDFTGNKITYKITNLRIVGKIVNSSKKRQELLNELRKVL